MEFDQDTHDKIIEIAKDIKFIREQLSEGKETFKEHDKRLRILESNQQLLTGKITIIITLIGASILFVVNVLMRLWK